ncbi:hypothetical protein HanPSC8_Chr03g0133611 [Helianthus annuus]|nr:hypothetical protein HanPSC8_Chr03g0133611 [Helianthus annuus]
MDGGCLMQKIRMVGGGARVLPRHLQVVKDHHARPAHIVVPLGVHTLRLFYSFFCSQIYIISSLGVNEPSRS